MKTFVQRIPGEALLDPDMLVAHAPDYYTPRFEAIAELRKLDDGSLHRGNEFRRVASLTNVPLVLALKMQNPEFLGDKKNFYRWLNDPERGGRYKTYDKRGADHPTETYFDGKPV